MSALKVAERKIQPFQLSIQELSALKNARFSSFGCIDSLININLFPLILKLFLFTSRLDKSEVSTPSSSISGVEKVPLNPLGTNSSLCDITNSTFSIVCSPDEAVKSEDVSSVPIPNGIFSREQKILQKDEFQELLLKKLSVEKLDQFLKHNFSSMYQLKKGYLEKISQEVKKTKSNQVDVRFEEINKEDLPFEAKDIVPILQDFITGIKSKRKKREQNSVITEKDNFHRSGYLAFIQVVWMELGN